MLSLPGLLRAIPGLLLAALALTAPALRRQDGWPLPEAWAPAAAGLGLALLGALWDTRWRRSAALFALALAGQASALALRHSPPWNVLEHYYPWSEIASGPRALLLLGPLAQSAVAATALARAAPPGLARLRALLSPLRALVLVAVVAFSAVNASADVARSLGELALALWITAVNLANLVLVAAAAPREALAAVAARLDLRFAPDGAPPSGWDRALPWLAAGWATALSALLAALVFERIPHIPDDVSYLFQAKYLATGRLYLPAPPDAASFEVGQAMNDGVKWYGYGSPAWPAVLALGVRAGAPWLVNPLLAGVTLLLAHALVRRWYGRRTAHATVLLLAVSPWLLYMGATFLTHTLSGVLTLGALLALERARGIRPVTWGALGGAALGMLFLTRPLEGVLVALPIGVFALGLGAPRLPFVALAVAGAAGLGVGGLAFPYNRTLTGSSTTFPIEKWTDTVWYPGANRLGFGPDVGNAGWPHLDPLPGHGPLDVLINVNQNLYMTSFELFGWGFGSLGFALLFVLWRRWTVPDRLLLAIVASVVAGHSIYWFSGGPDVGARYWYQVLVPLVMLTVRGIDEMRRRWLEAGGTPMGGLRLMALVAAASASALLTQVPVRSLGKYHHYRGLHGDMARLADERSFGRALVFVREGHKGDYPSAFLLNPPTLEGDGPIFARDTGPEGRAAVRRAFPDRPVWTVSGSGELGGPFAVVEGPIPPERPATAPAQP